MTENETLKVPPADRGSTPEGSPPILEVRELSHVYGAGTSRNVAIARISFGVRPGEFLSIVGPSGAGKTTLLKCLSGLMASTGGSAHFEGAEITEPPARMALVFQDYGRSLFPWLTVEGNVGLPLRHRSIAKSERAARIDEALRAVGLGDVGGRYPWQLSGGMQQRVALARALAYKPDCLLMDEPFASVDAQTRLDLEDLVLQVRDEFGVTIVFVTHDIDEAVYLSDRVVALTGSPAEVKEVVEIALESPRDQIVTKSDPKFANYRAHLLELIRRPESS